MEIKTKKAEQSKLTRMALLKAARDLFTEYGYADTPTEEIVKRAGVTRGALYYQFQDKRALFQAVLEDLDREAIQKVIMAMQSEQGDLWERLIHTGCNTFLDICLDPALQRISLIEGRTVLGWSTCYRIDEEIALVTIRDTLRTVSDAGLIAPHPLEPLSRLILGILIEAALYIAQADDIPTAREEMGASVESLMDGLRVRG